MSRDARACEQHPDGHLHRVSTVLVDRGDVQTSACCASVELAMALMRARLAQQIVAGAEPPQQGDAQDAAAREAATSAVKNRAGGAEAPAMNAPDECPVGGPHCFEKIDPRDADTWGLTVHKCVECGARPEAER